MASYTSASQPRMTDVSTWQASSLHQPSYVMREEHEALLDAQAPAQVTQQSRIKSFPSGEVTSTIRPAGSSEDSVPHDQHHVARPSKIRIYWVTPVAATLLFLLGLGAAIGHCVFFSMIRDQPVGNQTWTLRYSLALAFVFKSSLAASISLALAQHAWATLQHSKTGTSIRTIDAMFLSGSSLFSFLSVPLWKSAIGTALVATCIWLMPFTALIAPTALTIGVTSINNTKNDCSVRTVDWDANRDFYGPVASRALYVTDNSDIHITPSADSKRLSSSVLENGRQIGWPSPCGSNCTYTVDFTGPSWKCTQLSNVNDPQAPWKPEFNNTGPYWCSEKPVTRENSDNLLYGPVYYSGLTPSTNQFWAAFASAYTRSLFPWEDHYGEPLCKVLDVQAYECQVAHTAYTMQVTYQDSIQTNKLLKAEPLSIIEIASEGWNGYGRYSDPDKKYEQQVPKAHQDLIGLYLPMIKLLHGQIRRDPRYELVADTTLGQVPTLIHNLRINTSYAAETPYLPRRDLGSLLQDLSYNLTISLMSNPDLLVTSSSTVPCHSSHTVTVWKVDWLPIIIAYSTGLGVALICLGFGARALFSNGVAHDTSFSSVVRTTRNEGLDRLFGPEDVGALPLSKSARAHKLRFLDGRSNGYVSEASVKARNGFVLAD